MRDRDIIIYAILDVLIPLAIAAIVLALALAAESIFLGVAR